MDTGLEIRVAVPADAALLTELSVTTFRDAFGPMNRREDMDLYIAEAMTHEKLLAELTDAGNLFYLLYAGGRDAGYAKLRSGHEPGALLHTRAIEIERIYVRSQYQGREAGGALMQQCLRYAAENGYEWIWLGVWEHNYRAQQFYRRWGFELFGDHPFLLGSDLQTDVLMKRRL